MAQVTQKEQNLKLKSFHSGFYFKFLRFHQQGVESFTISIINLSIDSSNKRFFNKLYEGPRPESIIYVLKLRDNFYIVLICSFGSITGKILQL